MTIPEPYGAFHIFFVLLSGFVCFLLCRFFKNPSEKTVKKILLAYSIICIWLEIFKQIAFTFGVKNEIIIADYQWYAFPFQFCSTPMFVALLAALIPSKRFYRASLAYLSTFGFIAGVLVMAIPHSVFTDIIGVNIQTMVHHGSQITIGLFLLIRCRAIENLSSTLGGITIFLGAISIALILNFTVIHFIPKGEIFNMFFVSPYFDSTLPIYNKIQDQVPYPIFLFLYIFPFVTGAFGMHAFIYSLPRLIIASKQKDKISPHGGNQCL